MTPVEPGPTPARNDDELPAGRFSEWIAGAVSAEAAGTEVDVPCGSCTACCRSSYFVHIQPHEVETLRRIPVALRFPAPGLPAGNVLLGYDERGHCPMLVDDRCSIYEHRPLTCRAYDCRIFAAAGLSPEADGKVAIAERVRRWRFAHTTTTDEVEHAAVVAAASFLSARGDSFPGGKPPTSAGQIASSAVKVHRAFLGEDGAGHVAIVEPTAEAVQVALLR